MKKRYRILRIAIVLIKFFAIVECVLLLVRWTFLFGLIQGYVTALGLQLDTTAVQAITDIVQDAVVIVLGIFLWARAEYLQARIDTEENTRATAELLARLVKYQIPDDDILDMKSPNSIWEEMPTAAVPDDKRKHRVPAAAANPVAQVDKRSRPQQTISTAPPEADHSAFRRPKKPGDPPAW